MEHWGVCVWCPSMKEAASGGDGLGGGSHVSADMEGMMRPGHPNGRWQEDGQQGPWVP